MMKEALASWPIYITSRGSLTILAQARLVITSPLLSKSEIASAATTCFAPADAHADNELPFKKIKFSQPVHGDAGHPVKLTRQAGSH